jgi:methylated-DNA-[protein]-cysteine S-methyltransferase
MLSDSDLMGTKSLKAADVYEVLTRIPKGKVSTYGDIARAIGSQGASRAVGKILNMNPNPVVVPCHRVVLSDGRIGGYAFGTNRKKQLLVSEGLRFHGDRMADFSNRRVSVEALR